MRPFAMDSYGMKVIKESSLHTTFAPEESEATLTDEQGQDLLETARSSTDCQVLESKENVQHVSWTWEDDIDSLIEIDQLASVYGLYYREIMPTDFDCQVHSGEPLYTNYAHTYSGTLDYIFTEQSQKNIICTGLLAMPDLSLLSHGQPEESKFCSDHFCMLAEFGVTMLDKS